MKYSNLRAFEKHLEGASPSHYATLYGILCKDDYLRKEALTILLNHLLRNQSNRDLCTKSFDGDKFNASQFFQELEGMSLFADRRFVILNNCDKITKAHTEKLEKYFVAQNPRTTLILTAATVNRNTNYYKKAEKAGVFLDIPEEKPWERERSIQEWMHRFAATQGNKRIQPPAAEALVKLIGTDHARHHMELEKLFCYVGDRPEITLQDVGACVAGVNVENIWQLSEALFQRQPVNALRIGKALLKDGTEIIALLRQLRSQFQTEFQICSILANGGTPQHVSAEFPYMNGHILDRHIKQAHSFGMKRFQEAMLLIDSTEMEAKNSAQDPELLFERLATTICLRR